MQHSLYADRSDRPYGLGRNDDDAAVHVRVADIAWSDAVVRDPAVDDVAEFVDDGSEQGRPGILLVDQNNLLLAP